MSSLSLIKRKRGFSQLQFSIENTSTASSWATRRQQLRARALRAAAALLQSALRVSWNHWDHNALVTQRPLNRKHVGFLSELKFWGFEKPFHLLKLWLENGDQKWKPCEIEVIFWRKKQQQKRMKMRRCCCQGLQVLLMGLFLLLSLVSARPEGGSGWSSSSANLPRGSASQQITNLQTQQGGLLPFPEGKKTKVST